MLILILILIGQLTAAETADSNQSRNFPHKLWTFWNTEITEAPLFTQLCVNNMRHFAHQSGWEFIQLNTATASKYLTQDSIRKLEVIKSKRPDIQLTSLSDLYRILILHDNGGMWLDTNSIFVRNLSWVDNIEKQSIVENKVSLQPDLIMFTYNQFYGGNRTTVYDERFQRNIVLFPGIENWSFLAKPLSPLLKDTIDEIINCVSQESLELYYQQNSEKGYEYLNEGISYFLFGDYAFQTVLQKKQKQIDRNPDRFVDKYAVEYYKIWTIDAAKTAFIFFQSSQWIFSTVKHNVFYESLESVIPAENLESLYFIKFTGQYYHEIALLIKVAPVYDCLQAIQPFPQNSIIRQHFFKYSQHLEIVKQFEEIRTKRQNGELADCSIFSQDLSQYFNKLVVKIILGIILLNLLVFWAIKCLHSRLQQSQTNSSPPYEIIEQEEKSSFSNQ